MYGGGSQGDRIFAEFQAKLLSEGRPREDDPVEDHMNRVERLVLTWTAVDMAIAGAALWIAGPLLAVVVSSVATFAALAAMYRIERVRRERVEVT